jgi:uncharacterized protein (TIGR00369 family)
MTPKPVAVAAPVVFEPEFIAGMRQLTEEMISFNKLLGLQLVSVTPDEACARLVMKPELIGHFAYGRIHGGAISAALDSMGGVAVMAAIAAKHMDEPVAQRMQRFGRLGTIDLRVDFLRQGIGEAFTVRGQVLRLGSRVASTRMEFLAEDGTLLSTGAAAYIVS